MTEKTPAPVSSPGNPKKGAFLEILGSFSRLGFLGFGGPIALLAMMEEEFCRERKWLTAEHFSQVYALLKVMPGAVSTQMAIYLGYLRGGILGGILSGTVFVLPAFVLVLVLSYFYFSVGYLQNSVSLTGVQVGALIVIFLSTWQLSKPYRVRKVAWLIAGASGLAVWFSPRSEPLVIFLAGAIGILLGAFAARRGAPVQSAAKGSSPPRSLLSFAGLPLGAMAFSGWELPAAWKLFFVCLKAGLFVFGTGLAIVPMLEGDTVLHHHWLTHSEFMDGLALGQVTPGPVVITVTFIGYKVAGVCGALLATVGIFLPAFFNVLVLFPRIWGKFLGTPVASWFARWAIPSVIGCILGTSVRLGYITLVQPVDWLIFAAGMVLGPAFKLPAWILIPAAGLLDYFGHALLSLF